VETRILLAIHTWSSPVLDGVFWVSHLLGTAWFCIPLVLAAALWNHRRGERAEAWLWIALGLSTFLLQEWLKLVVARPRPALWPRLVDVIGLSFPSGHALASATFFPLLARARALTHEGRAARAYAAAVLLALFVGFGRLYLGVHWPSDVLAGWAIGAAQTLLAIHVRNRFGSDVRAPG
jgi:undecaprenyl-diphosphatase